MNTNFDFEKFERLKGLEAGLYCAKWSQAHTVGEDFLSYFKRKASSFDDEHLEQALALLAKTSYPNAYHEIANYMQHPYASVRLLARNVISHLPSIDEIIMAHVVSTLASPVDTLGIQELRTALEHPANAAAKNIAEQYLGTKGKAESSSR